MMKLFWIIFLILLGVFLLGLAGVYKPYGQNRDAYGEAVNY